MCTSIGNSCLPITQEMFNYRMIHDDFNSCIKDGLGQSFEVFYNSPLLTDEQINKSMMYPRFVCAPFTPEQAET
jgi:hypothetical protein